jgi:hypothetical protein
VQQIPIITSDWLRKTEREILSFIYYTPTHRVMSGGYIAITLSVRPSVCPSVRSHFRNRYISFYWKKWFYIWYMPLAWWLVPCLPFPGLPHIYFLFAVRLTNERVGVFLARRSVQHLVYSHILSYIAVRESSQLYFEAKDSCPVECSDGCCKTIAACETVVDQNSRGFYC